MVTIACLDDKDVEQTFSVHKSFIVHYSTYYNAVFNGHFSEGQTQSVKQYPISVESFGIFINWLYSQKIEVEEGTSPTAKELINVWILADEKLIPSLQNQVIEALNDQFAKEGVPTEVFGLVYEHTTEHSPLRAMIVDLCVSQLANIEFGDDVPREVLIDILKASADSKSHKANKLSKDKIKKYFVEEEAFERRSGISGADAEGSKDLIWS